MPKDAKNAPETTQKRANAEDDIEGGCNYTFPARLKRVILDRSPSLSAAARDLDTSRANLQNWCAGRFEPSLVWLARLAAYGGVSLDYLVMGYDAPISGQMRQIMRGIEAEIGGKLVVLPFDKNAR